MIQPRVDERGRYPLAVVIAFLWTALMILLFLRVRINIEVPLEAMPAKISAPDIVWFGGSVPRILARINILLVVWLWLSYRWRSTPGDPRVRSRLRLVACLGSALLLAVLSWATYRGTLAARSDQYELRQIHPDPSAEGAHAPGTIE